MMRTCQTCRNWFCHPPIRIVYGEAWGKCMLAQEQSRATFCCGSWAVPTFVVEREEKVSKEETTK